MPDLRASVAYLLRLRIPFGSEDLATLAAVDPIRAKAYLTQLAKVPICAVKLRAGGFCIPGRYARRWIALVPKTRPGGNATEYRRQREVRERLEHRAWEAAKAGTLEVLTSQQDAGDSMVPQEDASVPNVAATMGLTLKQAAEMAQCSEDTIRRRVHDGTIRAVRIAGTRLVRIPHDQMARLSQPHEVHRA